MGYNGVVVRTPPHLSSYLCVVPRSIVNIQHSIGCLVVFSWYDVITCESSVHTFRRFFYNILMFWCSSIFTCYSHTTYDQQFTLTTKKSLHIIFNAHNGSLSDGDRRARCTHYTDAYNAHMMAFDLIRPCLNDCG